jgi:predicted signal transduction protein with EAL and GGDEF domain
MFLQRLAKCPLAITPSLRRGALLIGLASSAFAHANDGIAVPRWSFSELADNPDDQAIAMAVISLGHKLNLRVIAEGVETEQQCRFLRENDCDEMQGYLCSRPLPPDDVAALLRAQARRDCPAMLNRETDDAAAY